ncbi:asparagine synthetase B family protein [Thiobacter aerophilum]|uniref:asparagine synthase (glutamine-hydrolyzing) n=1 Tax=Thiobacter aerophilum TaxID=3121275 RepID=A0ABV0EDU6_9BURK
MLCGWLGIRTDDAADVLHGMGQGASPIVLQPDAGLAVHSPFGRASGHFQAGLAVALHGRVRFADDALAAIAAEHGPAAAVAQGFRRHGLDVLNALRGGFALALMEPATRTLLLALDRMGIEKLGFAASPQGVVFGRNLDSVTQHPAVGARLSAQGLFDYLHAHMVPSPDSIYRGVEKLLPAQYLLWRDGRSERGFYWEAIWEDAETNAFDARASQLHSLLEEAVRAALEKDRAGAFLSGGLDSSTVCGMLARVAGHADSFSIGFAAEGYDEMGYARIAVRHFGLTPHEYYVTPADVAAAIPLIAQAYDEPFGNASAVPTYYCALRAREAGLPLLLAGDGGDEIFGGNARYAKQMMFEHYQRLPSSLRSAVIEPLARRLPDGRAVLRKAKRYVEQARIPLPDRLETYNFLHRDPLPEIFDRAFLEAVDTERPLAIQREAYFRTRARHPINRMLHLDWKQTLADNDLRKVERMAELAGIEVRYPMLDERLVDFASALPPSFKVRGASLRWFYKEALQDFLPREILTKRKHGFGLPFGVWMKADATLNALALDSLHAFRGRGILRKAYLDRLIAAHEAEHSSYYGVMIWVVMMLEQWLAAHSLSL